jgi:hypothetical protein
MSYTFTENEGFLIKNYSKYIDLPLGLLDEFSFAVHVIDYNWICLFLNKNSRPLFGRPSDELIGKSLLDIPQDSSFNLFFEKIRNGVDKKMCVHAVVDSPLNGQKILLKGHPLEDCYYFSFTVLPGKHEVIEELREELKRRSDNS